VLSSPESHLFFDIPNALLGALFYSACFVYTLPVLTFIPHRRVLFLLATAFACGLSLYLASVLIRMGDFCVLCTATYVLNGILFAIALFEFSSSGMSSSHSGVHGSDNVLSASKKKKSKHA
jgi:uncharacterized membrane protein